MATFSVDIEVYCNIHAKEKLSGDFSGLDIYIEPCDQCTDEAYDQGREEGEG